MAKARLYRFENGMWGVQRKFLFWWFHTTVPDHIGNEICQTTGMTQVYQTEDKVAAEWKRDCINNAGPVHEDGSTS